MSGVRWNNNLTITREQGHEAFVRLLNKHGSCVPGNCWKCLYYVYCTELFNVRHVILTLKMFDSKYTLSNFDSKFAAYLWVRCKDSELV